jgi:hypothetical protein
MKAALIKEHIAIGQQIVLQVFTDAAPPQYLSKLSKAFSVPSEFLFASWRKLYRTEIELNARILEKNPKQLAEYLTKLRNAKFCSFTSK